MHQDVLPHLPPPQTRARPRFWGVPRPHQLFLQPQLFLFAAAVVLKASLHLEWFPISRAMCWLEQPPGGRRQEGAAMAVYVGTKRRFRSLAKEAQLKSPSPVCSFLLFVLISHYLQHEEGGCRTGCGRGTAGPVGSPGEVVEQEGRLALPSARGGWKSCWVRHISWRPGDTSQPNVIMKRKALNPRRSKAWDGGVRAQGP